MISIRCAIIDDEPLAISLLESYVVKVPFLKLEGKFSSAVNAVEELKENPVDLVFLDIQMPQLSGMELAKMIPNTTRIIFTTAFSQYAIDGFRVNALDYLLKPISFGQFLEAANKALQWFSLKDESDKTETAASGEQLPPRSMFVKSEYKILQVQFSTIMYIEGLKDYVKIYTTVSSHPILSLMSMKSLEAILPPSQFIRVHKSFIVAKDKITEIDRNRIVFGDTYIPVGDSYRQAFLNFISAK